MDFTGAPLQTPRLFAECAVVNFCYNMPCRKVVELSAIPAAVASLSATTDELICISMMEDSMMIES